MFGWAENYLALIFQIYGLAFFVLSVVVFVLPRPDTALSFVPYLGWQPKASTFLGEDHSAQRELM